MGSATLLQSTMAPELDRAELLKQYALCNRRLFMFDYDGTLTPHVNDPSAATPSASLLKSLEALSADPENTVWIISGRDRDFLVKWLGHIPQLGLSAEHGCFMRQSRADPWHNLAEDLDMSWQAHALALFKRYSAQAPASWTEEKSVALTWHYREVEPSSLGAALAEKAVAELEATVARDHDVEIMAGRNVVEIRPRALNKGSIVDRLLGTFSEPPKFVMTAGDDFPDEDMFRSLVVAKLPKEHVFSIAIGPSTKKTLARWHLPEPSDMISALASLRGETSKC